MDQTGPVLILGGGIAGLTAAGELARNRVPVLLLERESRLGGHTARWACMATEKCQKCSACLVMDAKQKVLEDPLVRVYTCGDLDDVSIGNGSVRVRATPLQERSAGYRGGDDKREGEVLNAPVDWEVDALFVATGFTPFPAREKPLLHVEEFSQVMTTEDLDQVIREDRLSTLSVAGEPKPRVAFLQCVGSRDREAGRDYCSQVCCKTSLRFANRILHERPDLELTVFYIDLQIMGKGFREFYRSLKGRIRFVQGVPSEVLSAEGDQIALVYEDPAQGELKTESFGIVVLAVGMLPCDGSVRLAKILDLPLERGGFFKKVLGDKGSRLYSLGACCSPIDIPGARQQALEAVGCYLTQRLER